MKVPFLKPKFLFRLSLVLIAVGLSLTFICNRIVANSAKDQLYTSVSQIPYSKVGLLLGTSRDGRNGHHNPYYDRRITAALELLRAGKIKYILISGDNSRKTYSEPEMMRADLIAAGIDSTRIYLDYAGFRTFDSVIRLKAIFGQDSVTIISQKFHNERAVYIAKKEGIYAIGYNAKDVGARQGLKTQMREKLARVKVFVDALFGAKPKFLGEPVLIPKV
jgi:SanA protein